MSTPHCLTQLRPWSQVYDAATMAAEPLAAVALPQRVPGGFHGLFVSQADLDKQDKSVQAPDWEALSSGRWSSRASRPAA